MVAYEGVSTTFVTGFVAVAYEGVSTTGYNAVFAVGYVAEVLLITKKKCINYNGAFHYDLFYICSTRQRVENSLQAPLDSLLNSKQQWATEAGVGYGEGVLIAKGKNATITMWHFTMIYFTYVLQASVENCLQPTSNSFSNSKQQWTTNNNS